MGPKTSTGPRPGLAKNKNTGFCGVSCGGSDCGSRIGGGGGGGAGGGSEGCCYRRRCRDGDGGMCTDSSVAGIISTLKGLHKGPYLLTYIIWPFKSSSNSFNETSD